MVTGIGSFPFTDVDETIDLIFAACRQIPFWPQLPKRAPYENMYIPFLESVPAVVVDEASGSAYVDTERTKGIERFYEDFAHDRLEAFRVSERVAPGFHRFLERLKEIEGDVQSIKMQLTGPFSVGLGLKDEHGKPIIYNDGFFDIIKKALHMKARWMIAAAQSLYPEKEVIMFFDEPYMISFGSAYVSVSKKDAVSLLNEVLGGIHAKKGIHCCGNTDWSVLFNVDVDIVNYDAFNYLKTILYFEEDLKRFLGRGGMVSPGIVPSSEKVLDTSIDDVLGLWRTFIGHMEKIDAAAARKDWLVTPSCGLGSLKTSEARKAMELLRLFGG